MSATTSAATGRCFGIQRVCQVWERSRSALYARRAPTSVCWPSFPPTDPSPGAPFPPRGFVGMIPPLHR